MLHYTVSTSFLILGGIYFVAILAGALAYRVPPHGWKPTGWDPATARGNLRRVSEPWLTGVAPPAREQY